MKLTREQRIEAHSLADSMDRDDMAYEIVGLRAEVEKLRRRINDHVTHREPILTNSEKPFLTNYSRPAYNKEAAHLDLAIDGIRPEYNKEAGDG